MKEIAKAMVSIQRDIENPANTSINPHFKSRYAKLDVIIDVIKPLACKHGVWFHSATITEDEKHYLVTRVVHMESGEYVEDKIPLLLTRGNMQDLGGATTYARRYSLCNLFGIVGEDDDDGNYNAKRPTITSRPVKPKPFSMFAEKMNGLHGGDEHKRKYLISLLGDFEPAHSKEDGQYWNTQLDKLRTVTSEQIKRAVEG